MIIPCVHACPGCFIAPLTFQMYWRSFPIGDPTGDYKAPYANIYRGMAILGTQVRAHAGSMLSMLLLCPMCSHHSAWRMW